METVTEEGQGASRKYDFPQLSMFPTGVHVGDVQTENTKLIHRTLLHPSPAPAALPEDTTQRRLVQ
jgi:hypothetical protein